MGTYRQPSQIIDQRLNHFRKNFKEGLERQAKKDKLELSQLEKLKKAEAKQAADKKKNIAKTNKSILESNAEINAFGDSQGYLGYDLVRNQNGQTKLVQINDAQVALLNKMYSGATKVDDDNNPLTPDVWQLSYNPTAKEKELINDDVYSVRRLQWDDKTDQFVSQDIALSKFYEDEKEAGHKPFGLGVKGSIEKSIRDNYDVMNQHADDPDNPYYQEAEQNIKTGIEQYNKFNSVMHQNSENIKTILDSDGNVQKLGTVGSVLMQKDENFIMNMNASIDWMTGQNKHRFKTELHDGQMIVKYFNPSISQAVLEIPYNDLINNVKKKGFGLVNTTQEKPVELMYDYIQAGIKDFYKPIRQTDQNTYYVGNKKITEKQAIEIWDEANEKMENFVKSYFYGSDREVGDGKMGSGTFTKSPHAQNNWQLLNGAEATGNIYWGDGDLNEQQQHQQQDYMVQSVINKLKTEHGADMGAFGGNVTTTYNTIQEVKKQKAKAKKEEKDSDWARKEVIEISGFEDLGFKRDSGKYSFPELKQNFERLKNNPQRTVELLNYLSSNYGPQKNARSYKTGADVNEENKQWNKDNEQAILDGDLEKAATNYDPKAIIANLSPNNVNPKWSELDKTWEKFAYEIGEALNLRESEVTKLIRDAAKITSTDELTLLEEDASAEDLFNMLSA